MYMSLDYILGQLWVLINSGMAVFTEKSSALNQADLITLVVIAVVGGLFCFFGLKMVRFWAAVFGLAVGLCGGFYLASYFGLEGYIPLIIGAVAGIILAVLGARFYLAGVFLVGWILGIAGSAYVMQPKEWKFALICVAIGLVIGLITLKFAEPVTMLITAVFGGFAAGQAIYIMLPLENNIAHIAIIVVLVVLGILLQFLLESKRRKNQHLKKAEEIRSKHSVSNEVEKARAMMENLDQNTEHQDSVNLKKDMAEEDEAEVINLDSMEDDFEYDDELDEDEFEEEDLEEFDEADEDILILDDEK